MKACVVSGKCWALFLAIVVLSACQSTPEIDYVDTTSEYTYKEGTAISLPSNAIHEARDWNWTDLEYQDTYQGADSDVTVVIDVKSRYVNEPVPVLRVSHHTYIPEEVKALAQAIMPSDKYYDVRDYLSEETIDAWIGDYENQLNEASAKQEEILKTRIKRLEEHKRHCVDKAEDAETDWRFKEYGYYDLINDSKHDPEYLEEELRIQTRPVEGEFNYMHLWQLEGESFRTSEIEYCKANKYHNTAWLFGARDLKADPPSKLDKIQTVSMIQKYLDSIGLGYYKPYKYDSGANGPSPLYWFAPSYLGLEYITSQIRSEYSENHGPECLYVNVSGDSVYHMKIFSKTDVVIEDEAPSMLSKDEILEKVRQYMQLIYTKARTQGNGFNGMLGAMYGDYPVKIVINDLRFGYVRIPIEDNPKEFRLVPAWVFCGNRYAQTPDEDIDLGLSFNPLRSSENILAINALDGSYIECGPEDFDEY